MVILPKKCFHQNEWEAVNLSKIHINYVNNTIYQIGGNKLEYLYLNDIYLLKILNYDSIIKLNKYYVFGILNNRKWKTV